MNQSDSRVIIDCSHTVHCGRRTGVQRVVWNIIKNAMLNAASSTPSSRVECTLAQDGQFWPYDASQPLQSTQMRSNVQAFLSPGYRKLATRICDSVKGKTLRKWLLPDPPKLGIFRPWLSLVERREQNERRKVQWQQPRAGDVLLLPDAYWCRMQVWPVVAAARAQGVKIATVIYDLIPITHSHLVSPNSTQTFIEYLEQAVMHSDLLIAISKTVRDECEVEISKRWPERLGALKLEYFHLGANLPSGSDPVQTPITELFQTSSSTAGPQAKNPYIAVSTFEPRKNYAYLLDVFDKLWQVHDDARLCLIGARGHMCQDLMDRIEQHPRYQQQLFKFHNLTDSDLQHCYRNARGVLCPSVVEGFGLPIVEALAFGRKAFLNDIPIHREVGRADCEYFNGTDTASLLQLLLNWETQIAAGAPISQQVRQPLTWRESAEQIIQHCEALQKADAFCKRAA